MKLRVLALAGLCFSPHGHTAHGLRKAAHAIASIWTSPCPDGSAYCGPSSSRSMINPQWLTDIDALQAAAVAAAKLNPTACDSQDLDGDSSDDNCAVTTQSDGDDDNNDPGGTR